MKIQFTPEVLKQLDELAAKHGVTRQELVDRALGKPGTAIEQKPADLLETLGVDTEKKISCDFCGKTREMVKALVIGGDGCICNQCVGAAVRQLFEKYGKDGWQ